LSDQSAVPTLEELAADPTKAVELTAEAARMLFIQARNVEGALLARLLTITATLTSSHESESAKTRWLRAKKVAARLDVPESYVYELARRGQIPSARLGKRYVRFPEADIEAWLTKLSKGAVDDRRYLTCHLRRGRKGTAPNSKAAGAHPNGTGGEGGSGA
jgi:excisionase family DNA binding protein